MQFEFYAWNKGQPWGKRTSEETIRLVTLRIFTRKQWMYLIWLAIVGTVSEVLQLLESVDASAKLLLLLTILIAKQAVL